MNFQRRVKTERLRLGLTQDQLARELGLTNTCVSRYERGVAMPSLATLQKLARVFKTTIDELCGSTKAA